MKFFEIMKYGVFEENQIERISFIYEEEEKERVCVGFKTSIPPPSNQYLYFSQSFVFGPNFLSRSQQ